MKYYDNEPIFQNQQFQLVCFITPSCDSGDEVIGKCRPFYSHRMSEHKFSRIDQYIGVISSKILMSFIL